MSNRYSEMKLSRKLNTNSNHIEYSPFILAALIIWSLRGSQECGICLLVLLDRVSVLRASPYKIVVMGCSISYVTLHLGGLRLG